MSDQLKPCPFCGGVHLKLYKGHHNSYVECRGCGTYGPDMPKGNWNARADLPATDAQIMTHPKVKALVEALRWYADDPSSQGDEARTALAAIKETDNE